MARKRRPRVGRHQFTSVTKRNQLFEQYYKGQNIVPDDEWDAFLSALQDDLPITFRVTGFREQNKELLRIIKSRFQSQISQLVVPAQSEDESSQSLSLHPLAWFPNQLAWQLNTNKFVVRKTKDLKLLHDFLVSEAESGNISRQEAVSMLPPLVMDIRSHHAVLDLCASPGSKASQLVELVHSDAEIQHGHEGYAEPTGIVVANDVDQKRCYMMIHQVKRLQSPCTLITQEDATCFPKLYAPDKQGEMRQFLFDRILADVPCSGDGTLRKNPDLWLRWTPNLGIAEHYLQLRILRRGLELLQNSPGDGDPSHSRLVYSTCSFNPLENEAVVANLLHACQGAVQLVPVERLPCLTYDADKINNQLFRVRPGLIRWRVMTKKGIWYDKYEDVPQNERSNIRPSLFPPSNVSELNLDRCIRVLPHDQNTGGFFLAVLEKVSALPWLRSRMAPIKKEQFESKAEETNSTVPESALVADSLQTGDAVPDQARKRPIDNRLLPVDGGKKARVFHENPFSYIDPSDDTDWLKIHQYYGLLTPTDQLVMNNHHSQRVFRAENLFYRSTGTDVRHRQLYYTNSLVKTLIQNNSNGGLRIINSGVRMFAIMEDKQFMGYRVLQDGVDLADAFLPASGGRRVRLTSSEYGDLILLLEEEMPLLSRLSKATQTECETLAPGPVLIEYCPAQSEQPDHKFIQCRLVFAGWRGIRSLRHYIGRRERLHLMRLANLEPKPPITGHTAELGPNIQESELIIMDNSDSPEID